MPEALRWISFFAVTTLVFVGLHFYLYRKMVVATTEDRRVRRIALIVLGALALLPFGARMTMRTAPDEWTRSFNLGAWLWWGTAIYLFVGLLTLGIAVAAYEVLVHRRRAAQRAVPAPVPSPERRVFLARTVAGAASFAAGAGVTYGAWRAFAEPEVTELAIKLPRLPRTLDGLTIVHVSDIHIGPILDRRFLDELVSRMNALKPDLVAITGDLVDGSVESIGPSVAALSNLRSRYGTYFCTGNHDYYSGDVEWSEALTGMGVNVLRNRRMTIGEGKDSLELIGVDDWSGARRSGRKGYDLDQAVAGLHPDRASVLLAHQPQQLGWDDAVKKGIGLQLSGHTHAGQMFPGTLLVGLIWPHAAGLRTEASGSHLFVSRGAGFWGPPMRVGSPPEIAKLVLTR